MTPEEQAQEDWLNQKAYQQPERRKANQNRSNPTPYGPERGGTAAAMSQLAALQAVGRPGNSQSVQPQARPSLNQASSFVAPDNRPGDQQMRGGPPMFADRQQPAGARESQPYAGEVSPSLSMGGMGASPSIGGRESQPSPVPGISPSAQWRDPFTSASPWGRPDAPGADAMNPSYSPQYRAPDNSFYMSGSSGLTDKQWRGGYRTNKRTGGIYKKGSQQDPFKHAQSGTPPKPEGQIPESSLNRTLRTSELFKQNRSRGKVRYG